MFKRIGVLISIAIVGAVSPAQQLSSRTKVAVAALMEHFETVGYATTDFIEVDLTTGIPPRYQLRVVPLRWPFLGILAGLKGLNPDAVAAVEKDYSGIVIGAGNFINPEGLGMASANQCYVGISDSGDHPDLEAYFHNASFEQVQGKQVHTWFVSEGEAHPNKREKFYASQVGDYLLVCNTSSLDKAHENDSQNNAFFASMYSSLKKGDAKLTLPDSLTAHPLWMYRNVVQRTIVGGTLPPDLNSLSLYMDLEDQDHAAVTFQIKSSNRTAQTVPLKVQTGFAMQQERDAEPGVWSTGKINFTKGEGYTSSTDSLMEMILDFGYGMMI